MSSRRDVRVLPVIVLVGVLGLLLLAGPAADLQPRARTGEAAVRGVPFWAVALIGLAAERVRMHYRTSEGRGVSLSLGLFAWSLLAPLTGAWTLALGTAASYLIDAVVTRNDPVKSTFNVVQGFTTATVMSTVHVLLSPSGLTGPAAWTAHVVALLVASGFQAVALTAAIWTHDGAEPAALQMRKFRTSLVVAPAMGLMAAACLQLWASDARAGVLGVAIVALVGVGLRLLDGRSALVRELEGAVSTLAEREVTDELTGLPNRRAFLLALGECLADPSAAVLVIDLHRFREVNESLGFEVGDAVLVEVGRRLSTLARPGDSVARLGADEFGVILRQVGDGGVGRKAAGRYARALDDPYTSDTVQVQCAGRLGLAMGSAEVADPEVLLRRAEVALNAAKQDGTDHAIWSPELTGDAPRRLMLASDLRTALVDGLTHNAYQPKVDVATGEVVGVEVLARWDHPTEGPVSPAEFIPVAEQTGLIRDLTRAVLVTALEDHRSWRRSGLALGVAVNISPAVLLDEQFVDMLVAEMGACGTEPGALTLEVTESIVLDDSARIEKSLARLESFGVRLSIDDYGTGYSSLSYLRRMRVDEIKVDRSFVTDMVARPSDQVLVESTIRLGHALGLQVVAEGVEDGATLERLRDLGCDLVQGWHLGRPMSSDDLLARCSPPAGGLPGSDPGEVRAS